MTAEHIASYFHGVSNLWITFFLSMLPITELRGSIPWAITLGNLSWYEAFIASIIGNFIPAFPLLLLMEQGIRFLSKFSLGKKVVDYFLRRTRKRAKAVEN
jgi:uncharacterized membrane protein